MKYEVSKIFSVASIACLFTDLNGVNAFVPLSGRAAVRVERGSNLSPLMALPFAERKPEVRNFERDWTFSEDNGDIYEAKGKMKAKIFLPEEGKVKGCVFFMHGFSQFTLAYRDTLFRIADHANVAVVSVDTGISSGIVAGEIIKNPFAAIKDRNYPQYVLQRALSEDTKQCIRMLTEGDELFKEFKIPKNAPIGVSGHSMGGGLSFPVAAEFPRINHVFTMAPVAGVPLFDPITEGIGKRTVKNSMLVAGSWDLLARPKNVEAIAAAAANGKKDSSIYVEIARGLHTGFEDDLVITSIPLEKVAGLFLGAFNFFEKLFIYNFTSFLRGSTGQLEGTELLMEFFFDKMAKNQKVTSQAADQYLEDNIKAKWDRKFDIRTV